MTNFVVAAYYTVGTGYAIEAEKLRASLVKFGVDHKIVAVPNLGTWQKNTQYKARFVLDTLLMARDAGDFRPHVFVDADAIFHAYPVLFETLDADAAFAWRDYSKFPSLSSRTRRELLSGTIFLRNLEGTPLVREWIAENDKNPMVWEQRNLQTVVARANGKLRIAELPATYCKIFDIMRNAGPAVIEHYQKSRVYRRQVDGRSAPHNFGPFGGGVRAVR
ncbi:MAG: hypothetical protein IMZ46_02260 [Acidobacteria bacterium]|nr:hypothetical protein [Acidobacteriota bacterium]